MLLNAFKFQAKKQKTEQKTSVVKSTPPTRSESPATIKSKEKSDEDSSMKSEKFLTPFMHALKNYRLNQNKNKNKKKATSDSDNEILEFLEALKKMSGDHIAINIHSASTNRASAVMYIPQMYHFAEKYFLVECEAPDKKEGKVKICKLDVSKLLDVDLRDRKGLNLHELLKNPLQIEVDSDESSEIGWKTLSRSNFDDILFSIEEVSVESSLNESSSDVYFKCTMGTSNTSTEMTDSCKGLLDSLSSSEDMLFSCENGKENVSLRMSRAEVSKEKNGLTCTVKLKKNVGTCVSRVNVKFIESGIQTEENEALKEVYEGLENEEKNFEKVEGEKNLKSAENSLKVEDKNFKIEGKDLKIKEKKSKTKENSKIEKITLKNEEKNSKFEKNNSNSGEINSNAEINLKGEEINTSEKETNSNVKETNLSNNSKNEGEIGLNNMQQNLVKKKEPNLLECNKNQLISKEKTIVLKMESMEKLQKVIEENIKTEQENDNNGIMLQLLYGTIFSVMYLGLNFNFTCA